MTLSWQRSTGTIDFFWKRARRIYPALAGCVVISILVGSMLSILEPITYFQHSQTREYLKTASAWTIKYALPGVFSNNPTPNAVNGSLWSLPYELRCYLFLILLGVMPVALRWKTLASAILLALYVLARPSMPLFDRYLGLDYYHAKLGLFFAIGATYACWRAKARAVWWAGLLETVVTCALPDSSFRTVLWGLSMSTLILGAALATPHRFVKLPERMGDWSYGLYLYAFPVQQIVAYLGFSKSLGLPGYVVVCTMASLVLAAFSWFVIERPALAYDRKEVHLHTTAEPSL